MFGNLSTTKCIDDLKKSLLPVYVQKLICTFKF